MSRSLFRTLITTVPFFLAGCLLSLCSSNVSAGNESIGDQVARILAQESAQQKIKIIVLDFRVSFLGTDQKPSDNEPKNAGSRFTDEFIADLLQKLNNAGKQDRIAIIDRSRLDDILRDIRSPAASTAERTPTELGALAGVDVVITGSLQVSGKTLTTMIKVVRIKDGEILGIVNQGDQEKPSRPAFAPISVIDGIEKIEIGAWKALPVNLIYPGTLHITINVERGNAIDVIVIAAPELEHLKKNEEFARKSAFTAARTKHYLRKADIESGSYYLVLRDSSTGVFSSRRSDIKVTVRLEP